jgi:hypothetical protein
LDDGGSCVEILNETPSLFELALDLLGFAGRCRLAFGQCQASSFTVALFGGGMSGLELGNAGSCSTSLRPISSRLAAAFSTGFQRWRARVSASNALLHFHAGSHQSKLVLPSPGADLPLRWTAAMFSKVVDAPSGGAAVVGRSLVHLRGPGLNVVH